MTLVIMPLLWLCLAAGSGGCNPKQDPTGPRPAEALTATEIAGIRLTYMCGNTFRVRNPNDQEVLVTWDLYQKNESGSLTLPPKPAGAAHSETFFTTVNKGTVRLFYNGQLIQTKANGDKPPCQTSSDTTRPVVPDESARITTNLVVPAPDLPEQLYHRNVLGIMFDDSTSGRTIRDLFQRYSAVIIGGFVHPDEEDEYFIQVPDPGPTWEAVQALIQRIGNEPGVLRAGPLSARTAVRIRSRYPEDAQFSIRSDWFQSPGSVGTQPRVAVRAPLAWGCETGLYGEYRPRIAIADYVFDHQHDDFERSTVRHDPLPSNVARVVSPWLTHPQFGPMVRAHGTGVAGVLAATGDNGKGIAGMVWGADLNLYAMADGQDEAQALDDRLRRILQHAGASGARIFLTSMGVGFGPDTMSVARLRGSMRSFLRSGGIIVVAIGNDQLRLNLSDLPTSQNPAVFASDRALAQLYPEYQDQIFFVAGTDRNGAFWSTSNFWLGATPISAPADSVLTLGIRAEPDLAFPNAPAGTRLFSGTSFSAPFVAGVAAQLLAMDPALPSSRVKDYIVRGAQEPKQDPTTGLVAPTGPLAGAPGESHQLDAYGALTLLSKERHGTPLCGVEVVTQHSSATGDTRMIANRNSPDVLIPDQPASLGTFSVAQGGRLFAVQDQGNGSTIPYRLMAGAWQAQTPITDAERVIYLERDTAYLRSQFGGRFDLQVRLNSGNWNTVTAGLPSGSAFAQYDIPFNSQPISPTGDYIYVVWVWANGPCADTLDVQTAGGGAYRVPLRGGSGPLPFYTFSEPNTCDFVHPTPSQQDHNVVWRRDGTELIRATWIGELGFAQLRRHGDEGNPGSLVATSTPVGEPSRFEHLDWSPEGGRLFGRLLLMRSSTCILTARQVTALDQALEPDRAVGWQVCPQKPTIVPLRQRFLATGPAERGGSPGGGTAMPVPRPQVSPLRRTAPQEFRLWAN